MSRMNVEKVARLLERYVNFPRQAWLPNRDADNRILLGHRLYRIWRMRDEATVLPRSLLRHVALPSSLQPPTAKNLVNLTNSLLPQLSAAHAGRRIVVACDLSVRLAEGAKQRELLQAEIRRNRLHCRNAKIDVLVEIHTQILGSAHDVVTIHGCCKRSVLHLFSHTFGLQSFKFGRTNHRACRDETTELVARIQRFIHRRDAGTIC